MRPKPVIYIAGPYRANSEYGVFQNIERAAAEAAWVWSVGGIALCPHKNTAFFGGAYNLPDSVWLEGGLILLERCDAVYLAPGWENSQGCLGERLHAERKKFAVLEGRRAVLDFIKHYGR